MKVVSADLHLQHKNRDADDTRCNNVDDSSATTSVVDAYATLERDKQSTRLTISIAFAVVKLAIFLAMLFTHFPATDTMFRLGNAVSSTLAASGADTITTDSRMKFSNIATISDTFDWLTDTFVPSVFVTQDYNGDALEKDQWGRVAQFNKVLGAVLFDTARAQIHPCAAEQFLVDLYPNCYDADTVTMELELISFDTNATEATNIIQRLKARGDWLDFATQSLTITVVMYNGELQAYAVTELTIAYNQGGVAEPSFSTTPALSDPYADDAAYVLDILVALSNAVVLWQYVARFKRRFRREETRQAHVHRHYVQRVVAILQEYLHAKLSRLAVAETVCVMCTLGFYIIWTGIVSLMANHTFRDNLAQLGVRGKKFDVNSVERNGLLAVTASLSYIASLTTSLRVFAVLAILLHGLVVLLQFHRHPQLGVLTRTIARTIHQFSAVAVVFAVVFVTYGAAGTVLFGDRVEGFASLNRSLETCVNMLFGGFDYASIQSVYVPAPMLFYWSYMVIVSLVLLNMMLAIVLDAYADVSAAQRSERATSVASMARVIDSIHSDLVDAMVLPRWLKRAQRRSAQAERSLCALLDSAIEDAPPLQALALCRDLAAEDVVARGRIRTRILRKLLRCLNSAQDVAVSSSNGDRTAGDSTATVRDKSDRIPPNALVVPNVVTAKALVDWFHAAQLSDAVARATMTYIRDGMTSSTDESDASMNAAATSGEVKHVDTKHEVESNNQREQIAAVGTRDAMATASTVTDQQQLQQDASASFALTPDVDTNTTTVSAQVAHLVEQMAAMQQTLDALVRQMPPSAT